MIKNIEKALVFALENGFSVENLSTELAVEQWPDPTSAFTVSYNDFNQGATRKIVGKRFSTAGEAAKFFLEKSALGSNIEPTNLEESLICLLDAGLAIDALADLSLFPVLADNDNGGGFKFVVDYFLCEESTNTNFLDDDDSAEEFSTAQEAAKFFLDKKKEGY